MGVHFHHLLTRSARSTVMGIFSALSIWSMFLIRDCKNLVKNILTSCSNMWYYNCVAGVAELADAPDLGSGAFGRGGSSPFSRTSL